MYSVRQVVDARGNPLGRNEDRIEDLNLPPGVQALVETRINDGVDRLREHNQAHLNALATDHAKKWRMLALISSLITILFAIWAPIQIPRWIRQYVEDHMTKPQMEEIADEAIRTKMGDYVDEKLLRVEQSADEALANVATLTNQVAVITSDFAGARSDFDSMSGEILALRQFFNARRGDRDSYSGLLLSAGKPEADLASALLQDVKEFYRDFKNETKGKQPGRWGREVVHVNTLTYCRFPAETIRRNILSHKDPYQRRAEVNDTARRGMQYFVEDLVTVTANDPNVFVASRAVSAIEHFTGKTFGDIPPFSDVAQWWQDEGRTNSSYLSPFDQIAEGDRLLNQRRFREAIAIYENCVSNRTGLATTHYNLFKAYWLTGDREQATNSLMMAISEADAPPDALLTYAHILTDEGKQDEAISKLAAAKPFLRDFAVVIAADPRFERLGTNTQFQTLLKKEE